VAKTKDGLGEQTQQQASIRQHRLTVYKETNSHCDVDRA